MFDIVLNKEGTKIPEDKPCYIIAQNGIFLRKKLGLVDALVPVEKISFLERLDPFGKLNIPKIPVRTFIKILNFFRLVYETHRGESVILLYYNKRRKRFKVDIPKQEVSGARLDYIRDKVYKDYTFIGTIHSHAGFGAFHSSTDDNDEKSIDGIHITVGNVDDIEFTISASIVINGRRFIYPPVDYIEGVEEVKEKEDPKPYNQKFFPYDNYFSLFDDGVLWYDKKGKMRYNKGSSYSNKPRYRIKPELAEKIDKRWLKIEIETKEEIIQRPESKNIPTQTMKLTREIPEFVIKSGTTRKLNKSPCESCIFKNYKIKEDEERKPQECGTSILRLSELEV